MTDLRRVLAAVLRIGDVALDRPALEAALGVSVERYEPLGSGPLHSAQLNLPIRDDVWGAVVGWAVTVGPRLELLRQKCLVGSTCIDLAVSFGASHASLSIVVPAHAAEIIGANGIDIEFSIYAVGDEQ